MTCTSHRLISIGALAGSVALVAACATGSSTGLTTNSSSPPDGVGDNGSGGTGGSSSAPSSGGSGPGSGGATSSGSSTAPGSGGSGPSSGAGGYGAGGSGAGGYGAGGYGAGGYGGGGPLPPSPNTIDDLESGTGSIITQQGRIGAWYTYNDETPTGLQTPAMGNPFVPSAPGRASAYAAHTVGNGFTSWGAGFGFDLNNAGSDASTRQPYDLSGFSGITFWVKGDATIQLMVATMDAVDVSDGGSCTVDCNDMHSVNIAVTDTWVEHQVSFADLAQEGWGTPVAFDPTQALAVQFQTGAAVAFAQWVDDVSLF